MIISQEVQNMCPVAQGVHHGAAPIPEEAKWVKAKEVKDISGFTHGVGWCAPQQGACKLTLNVKEGIIQEALVETIGCSGMTHSAAMASEILPGLTVMEALNTDLVCDAINTAMRELFLQIVYGRSQSAFSEDGLQVGAGLEDLGKGLRSQVGTMYGTLQKGPRYLEMAEGYVTGIALDEDDLIIGYQFVNLGKMTDFIKKGDDPNTAWAKSVGQYGRVDDAAKIIDPRTDKGVHLVQLQEIVGLHDHVVKLKEGQSLFHSLLVALRVQHPVYREMSSYLAQEIHIIQIQQPVRVIGQNRVVVVKVDETGQLILETFCIVLDGFLCHNLTHIGLTGGVSHHGGSAAQKGDGAMSRSLHVHHGHDGQEMSCGQAVCGGVKADVKGYFFLSEELSYLLRMGTLLDEAALHEYVINVFCHCSLPPN